MSIKRISLIGALLVLLLAIACSPISFYQKDAREFTSEAVIDPTNRYAIQVLDIDLLPKETFVHVRLTDRSERSGLGPENYWRNPDAQQVFLYRGEDRLDKKPLVSTEPHGLWWDKGSGEMTLVFGPIDDPDFQNTFKLQFVDFPEMQIHRTNPESSLSWIWAKTPNWLVVILLGLFSVAAVAYLKRHPSQAKSLKTAVRHTLNELSGPAQTIQQDNSLQDPVEAAKRDDTVKMRIAQERARNDVQFATRLNMARDLDTLVAIQEWQRQERRQVLDDPALTSDEKEERLAKINEVVVKEKERLNKSASIYTED